MPAPMPREAPVTRATLPARVGKGCARWVWVGGAACPFGMFVVVVCPFGISEGVAAPLVVVGEGLDDGASVVLGGAEEVGSDVGSGAEFERGGADVVVVVVVVGGGGGVGSAVTGRGWEICSWEMESIVDMIVRDDYLLFIIIISVVG